MAEQKKPNTFTKGMQSDVDANLLPSESYRKGHNVRAMSKSDNSFTLKNVTGHELSTLLSINKRAYTVSQTQLTSFCEPPIPGTDNVAYTLEIKNGASVVHSYTTIVSPTNTLTRLHSAVLSLASMVSEDDNIYILSFPPGSSGDLAFSITSYDSVQDLSIEFSATTTTATYNAGTENYNPVDVGLFVWSPAVVDSVLTQNVVGMASFSDYICVLTSGDLVDCIWKVLIDSNGDFSSASLILLGSFGFESGRSIKIESSEENEHYHRIYWIDGNSPLRSLNLKESIAFYIALSPGDLNVFKSSSLNPIEITSVSDGGNLDCGSYRYCYRLTTKGGNSSLISPICNPVSVYKSSKGSDYHDIEGGGVSEISGKSISFSVEIEDLTYENIQIIAIKTISTEGAIEASIISDSKLYGSTFNGQHTGGETKQVIPLSDVLSSAISWTTGKDLKTKDNRLFVSNLSNTSSSIDADFRVVSYNSNGSSFSTSTDYNNPDLRDSNLYLAESEGDNKYKFADTGGLYYGASSPDFSDPTKNGVRVSFRLKEFDLDSISATEQGGDHKVSGGTSYLVATPPFYGLSSRSGDDDSFNNYKNPVFANKYTGYQRNEVYRFAILFYDLSGQASFSYSIGDIRFPKATDNYTPIGGSGMPIYTPAECSVSSSYAVAGNYKGYAIHPHFEVNLSDDLLSKISGYSIVRAERESKDKSVLFNGIANEVVRYSSWEENRSMKDFNGNHPVSIFHSNPADSNQADAINSNLITVDSPEVIVGGDTYNNIGSDKVAVSHTLESFWINATDQGEIDGYYCPKSFRKESNTSIAYAIRFDPETNEVFSSWYPSAFAKLFQIGDHGTDAAKETEIFFGTTVASWGEVSSNNLTSSKGFKNGGRSHIQNDYTYRPVTESTTNSPGWDSESSTATDAAFSFASNDTVLIDTGGNNILWGASRTHGELLRDNESRSCKVMVQVLRNVEDTAYGGNSIGAFKATRYISTGSFVETPAQTTSIDVFGGDTYVNMFSLKKMNTPWTGYLSSDTFEMPHQAIIVPIESTLNLDLRSGIYFGRGDIQGGFQDDYLYNDTYSATNNSKLFLEKPADFKDVENYSNMIAASNLKINGSKLDAYTNFDANEIHEVDNSYGPIYNLLKLRNELFAVQGSGVSKLTINPRVVVSNDDIAAITISTGTGSVIERSDYIDTKYGSQHFNNGISTNNSAYWYDDANSSLCKLVFGQGVAVQDLGLTTQNSNLLDAYKDTAIGDSPLTGDGVSYHWNQRHDEIVCCIHSATKTSIVYSELMDVIVGTRDESSCMSINLSGETYSVGYKTLAGLNDTKIYKHEGESVNQNAFYEDATTAEMSVTFVVNENVYTSKVFDKLVLYLSGNSNEEKFTTFEFVDSLGNTITNTGENLGKMRVGKHILPIRDLTGSPAATTKMKGNYLIVTIKSSATEEIELFSALVHHRTTNI